MCQRDVSNKLTGVSVSFCRDYSVSVSFRKGSNLPIRVDEIHVKCDTCLLNLEHCGNRDKVETASSSDVVSSTNSS